jgi:hypothetical protein
VIELTIPTDGPYRIVSLGYGGGTLGDGTSVAPGGFDTIFTLADSAGNVLIENDDASSADPSDGNYAKPGMVNVDPVTNDAFDAVIVADLVAGSYKLAVTQWDNFANGNNLGAGFSRDGEGNFTAEDGFTDPCPPGTLAFCSYGGFARTGDWAVDVSPVPLPAALPLFVTAVLGLGWAGRRARRTA